MTKVLYISNYQDCTGYSIAAQNYILAMDSVGIDVVPRRLHITNQPGEIPARILELEQKSDSGCDVVIQHTLPHLFVYDGNFRKNIGMFATETTNVKQSYWAERCNLMDELWVFNDFSETCLLNSHVNKPIRIIPHAFDIDKYNRSYEKLELNPLVQDDYIFYFIGEMNRRKNLAGLLKAFHSEFDPNEPVSLLIKTKGNPAEVKHFCDEIKRGLKLYPDIKHYKEEIIITENLTEEVMFRLHKTCHCYVSTAYGEAWNIPATDAVCLGNPIIGTMYNSPYITKDMGCQVDTTLEPVFGMVDSFNDLYTGTELWAVPDLSEVQAAMRFMYVEKFKPDCQWFKDWIDYKNVGKLIERLLNV